MNLSSFSVLDPRWHLVLEIALVALLMAIALFAREGRAGGAATKIENAIVRLSDRPWLQALLVGALAIVLRAALLPVLSPPVPYFPDDFSLVLQGQMFALGHLSVPTHPLHHFFESYYVNHVPSYGSMYFPGRGAPLALGLILFDSAWVGVWLSMVVLAMTVPWMLRGWVSKPLALVGGVLVVVKFGVLSGWINSYHGAGLTALGGVLVVGAYPRLMREPSWLDSAALAAGLLLLMITRPFEGFLFSLPILASLAFRVLTKPGRLDLRLVGKIALPTVLLTSAGLLFLLVHNVATTGHMLVTPYDHHRASHAFAPAFLFQEPTKPTKAHPSYITRYYKNEAVEHSNRNSVAGVVDKTFRSIKNMLQFYVGAVFAIPFLLGLIAMRKHVTFMASGATLSLAVLATTWDFSQYWAPGFGLFMVLIMVGFGRLRTWRHRGSASGLFLSRALPLAAVAMVVTPSVALYAGVPKPAPEPFNRSCCAVHTTSPRSIVERRLLRTPGRDLVLVRHLAGEPPFLTLVANEPDIDRAEIVWAYDTGAANQRLLDYYPDRTVWRVEGTADAEAAFVRPPKARP